MGFFSVLCPGCNHSIRSSHSVKPVSEWMAQAVSFTKRRNSHVVEPSWVIRLGWYDGYGRIAGVQVVPLDRRASVYHEACWKILSVGNNWQPDKSEHAMDQGYFFVGEYDPPEPRTLVDLARLRHWADGMVRVELQQ